LNDFEQEFDDVSAPFSAIESDLFTISDEELKTEKQG
jgi:hypothetical protein